MLAAGVSLGFGAYQIFVDKPVKHYNRYHKELAESKNTSDSMAEFKLPYEGL
jgi:hypothetical protein